MASVPPPPKLLCQVRALYPYISEESSSLSFEKDDIIEVLAKLESGWWDGWCNGRRGWFPSNYVEVLSDRGIAHSQEPIPANDLYSPLLQNYLESTQAAPFTHTLDTSEINRINSTLPKGWILQIAEDGQSWYYYNQNTGEIQMHHPTHDLAETDQAVVDDQGIILNQRDSFLSDQSKQQDYPTTETEASTKELMDNWVERETPQGRVYYCNLLTQETTWDREEIDEETGRLKKSLPEEDQDQGENEYSAHPVSAHRASFQEESKKSEELTWQKISSDVAFSIHQLINTAQKGQYTELQPKTAMIVESVRLMLYASRSMEKDSQLLQDSVFKEPRRAIMSSLSKLVLSSKMGAEISGISASAPGTLQKIQKDANDVLVAVRNFVTLCQQRDVAISYVNPRLLSDISQLPYDPSTASSSNNYAKASTSENTPNSGSVIHLIDNKKIVVGNMVEARIPLTQKAKYLLNQDFVINLQAYAYQIHGSIEVFLKVVSSILGSETKDKADLQKIRADIVSMFRNVSNQISQYINVLDEVNLDHIDMNASSTVGYRISRQSLYTAVGRLFGATQTITNIDANLEKAVNTIHGSIDSVKDAIVNIEQSIIMMVNERKRIMGATHEDSIAVSPTSSNLAPVRRLSSGTVSLIHDQQAPLSPRSHEGLVDPEGMDFNSARRGTFASIAQTSNSLSVSNLNASGDLAARRRQQSIRTDNSASEVDDGLGPDYSPEEIEFSPEGLVRGGTLAALVERLTVHDSLDTNFIATFLLTYRSFTTTEEFVSLLEARYNMLPPDMLTPKQLVEWTERKQKLVRLRVFNIMKNWLENYYIDEDERLLGRFEYFANTNIRDTSSLAANQLLKLIKKRVELSSTGEMKKIVPNAVSGPDPIFPKNITNFQLLDIDPLEMARQLSVLDFKLYSSIRPIELLGKAWSNDGANGSVAVNIKQSISYCNQMTAWVTSSILTYEEPKKRATVIKFWVQVADQCRNLNNFNTCMAILSSFENSAIGRLKKTWAMTSRNIAHTLTQIRKLMGANRNFADYRDMIHSVNPPCIPFLGIYLQDLTFIEDGNPDSLPKSSGLINFAKRQKAAEVIRELQQFQNFAYNFHTIPELQDFIKKNMSVDHDPDELYERSLQLEPRTTDAQAAVNNIMTNLV
ncbi:ras guanine nucleotide exchange factor domain-containing protein [Blakeslea trispora]|nr:ras guanine nucleotide exchange factor domain-containing protein [Blakeslea trispora]